MPAAVQARVERVAGTVRQTIPRLDQLGTEHACRRTRSCAPRPATCPKRSPRTCGSRATSPTGARSSGGKTSLTILCDQLDLLGSKMDEVFDAACRADADALIAHGRFLAEKFSARARSPSIPQRR